MCDYSLHNVKSRPAKVGDKLTTQNFNTGTRGFAAPEDVRTAVCVLPGTELAFAKEVRCGQSRLFGWKANTVNHTTAIFRQLNKDNPRTHHDALEFPDGQMVLLTDVFEGQEATVLQLPTSIVPHSTTSKETSKPHSFKFCCRYSFIGSGNIWPEPLVEIITLDLTALSGP